MHPTPLPPVLRDALVVAVDDSACARAALAFATRLSSRTGEALQVVTVWNFVSGSGPQDQTSPPSVEAWQRHAEEGLATFVEKGLAAHVEDGPGARMHLTALHGNTTSTLLAISRIASHLVVGSRGRGGFAGLLLGSTSEQLVRHAGCPVTVVRSGTVGS